MAAQLENVIGKIGKCANDICATCTDQGKNMMKASNTLQNAQDQMKVILEIYDDKFIDFEDKEIDIGALENEEGNYSKAHTVCVEKSWQLADTHVRHFLWRTCVSASCQGHYVNV